MDWRKASFSMNGGNCVEVSSGVSVRDTQDSDGFVLSVSPEAWQTFISTIKC